LFDITKKTEIGCLYHKI